MRKSMFAIASIFFILTVWLVLGSGQPRAAEGGKLPMQKWEYRWMPAEFGQTGNIDQLGAEGWEACGVATESTFQQGNVYHSQVLFKRPKQ